MGQIGYYCTDTFTPIISELLEELKWDATTVSAAVDISIGSNGDGNSNNKNSSSNSNKNKNAAISVVYALCTHPGHHAARDSFGGYCYVNNAALAARLLQERLLLLLSLSLSAVVAQRPNNIKVAILDVDYHCGNGTASIFYDDPNVLVVSIHCHPDFEYPFHSGYGDETGGSAGGNDSGDDDNDAKGCTLHLPLLPGATWKDDYETALRDKAGKAIMDFNPDAFVLSLGLDTHVNDPCATRRAGFQLKGSGNDDDDDDDDDANNDDGGDSDYHCMGQAIGEIISGCRNSNHNSNNRRTIPTIVLQEGGYEMKAVPSAAADVLLGMATTMGSCTDMHAC